MFLISADLSQTLLHTLGLIRYCTICICSYFPIDSYIFISFFYNICVYIFTFTLPVIPSRFDCLPAVTFCLFFGLLFFFAVLVLTDALECLEIYSSEMFVVL